MCLKTRVYNQFTVIELLKAEYSNIEIDALKIKTKDLIQQGHNHLILNIVRLKYINKEFLKALRIIHLYTKSHQGKISICNPDYEIELILYLVGLEKIIRIYTTELEAMGQYDGLNHFKIA